MNEESKRVVLITGAGSGMGFRAVERFLLQGWSVAALDVNTDALDKLVSDGRLLILAVDVRSSEELAIAVQKIEAGFGTIDRVMHAAAIMPLGPLIDQSPSVIRNIMDINYQGLVNIVHATLPGMLKRNCGEFVSFSSLVGAVPVRYMGAYAASKAAVSTFTEVLAEENFRSGIQFVCVCPPVVATPLLDQARDTMWPKVLDEAKPMAPDDILDQVEKALKKGQFWLYPGPLLSTVYRCYQLFTAGYEKWCQPCYGK